MRLSTIALSALGLLPLVGMAQPRQPLPVPAAATHLPAALQRPLLQGFHVISTFRAASGLTGWVLRSPQGAYNIVYTTADGQTLLVGDLLTSAGEDLAEAYSRQYLPAPDLHALWPELQKAAVVVTGASRPRSTIYVVMDPNCIYCHMLWIALRPYEAAGLQVKWIPVGFLHEDSAAKAAALLKFGSHALDEAQQHFDLNTESGGIAGIPITPELARQLDANMRFMNEARIDGTPGVFYQNAAGTLFRHDGMPMLSELPAITGLPAQPETDPQLARFARTS